MKSIAWHCSVLSSKLVVVILADLDRMSHNILQQLSKDKSSDLGEAN